MEGQPGGELHGQPAGHMRLYAFLGGIQSLLNGLVRAGRKRADKDLGIAMVRRNLDARDGKQAAKPRVGYFADEGFRDESLNAGFNFLISHGHGNGSNPAVGKICFLSDNFNLKIKQFRPAFLFKIFHKFGQRTFQKAGIVADHCQSEHGVLRMVLEVNLRHRYVVVVSPAVLKRTKNAALLAQVQGIANF